MVNIKILIIVLNSIILPEQLSIGTKGTLDKKFLIPL